MQDKNIFGYSTIFIIVSMPSIDVLLIVRREDCLN